MSAAIGDIVNFTFVAGNHTATQSTFADPCLNAGFTSGFQAVGTSGSPTTFSILVNTTSPTWVYCAQAGHCQAGMVMAINAPTSGNKTFAAFQALAKGDVNSPGGSTPTPAASVSGGGSASSASSSVSSTPGASAASGAASAAPSGGALASSTPSTWYLILSLGVPFLFKF
ncbi:hypothetical protein BD324DRAFT_653222 [Kockovaella imperatae]|uniref:Phytocyanin domain-containing protein n=1 Tax=Kockovaella imperatae TaxID=4999 RepID=A0A1Y1UBI7_9TREE|nr:hypothetical protein BD324DRAFT_653222 [Kockovaella imperatae]ORX34445.1 hypothetical protein BD324DRAFT_653222 [Kockovaella imperatae]